MKYENIPTPVTRARRITSSIEHERYTLNQHMANIFDVEDYLPDNWELVFRIHKLMEKEKYMDIVELVKSRLPQKKQVFGLIQIVIFVKNRVVSNALWEELVSKSMENLNSFPGTAAIHNRKLTKRVTFDPVKTKEKLQEKYELLKDFEEKLDELMTELLGSEENKFFRLPIIRNT